MSDLEVHYEQSAMEETGEMQFIRDHLAAARGEALAPAPEADTVEDTTVEEPSVEEPAEESSAPDDSPAEEETVEDAELTAEEEETLYLELDDATQSLIDTKYGGDLNKALAALTESQSLIGRQGTELGAIRAQLEALQTAVEKGQIMAQPYSEWPDEFAEPAEAAMAYRRIAEEAFAREDVDTFSSAVDAWLESDPVGASTYRDLKILQLQTAMSQAPASAQDAEATLAAGIASVKEKYTKFGAQDPAFMADFSAELEKFPTLRALLWGEIPGTTVEQRLAALDETVGRVASRHVADTEQRARRRVAVKQSEEARQARREAQVISGETARVVEEEKPKRVVPLGETGKVLDIDRLNAMLPPGDRL